MASTEDTRKPLSSHSMRVDLRELQRRQTNIDYERPREIGYSSSEAEGGVCRMNKSCLAKLCIPQLPCDLNAFLDEWIQRQEAAKKPAPDPFQPIPGAPLEHIFAMHAHFCEDGDVYDSHLITYRNNINKIMGTPYNDRFPWILAVYRRHGCLIMDVRINEETEKNPIPHEINYRGHRFEHCVTGGDLSKPCGGKENYNTLVSSALAEYDDDRRIGAYNILFSSEIDCIDDKGEYVELKVTPRIDNGRARQNFERKLLKYWIQSYMPGVPKILCGFRDDRGTLQAVETFDTLQIPVIVNSNKRTPLWEPEVCLRFLYDVIAFLLDKLEDHNQGLLYYDAKRKEVVLDLYTSTALPDCIDFPPHHPRKRARIGGGDQAPGRSTEEEGKEGPGDPS